MPASAAPKARRGSGCRCRRAHRRSGAGRRAAPWRSSAANPSVDAPRCPVTKIRSPGRAPSRVSSRGPAAPARVRERKIPAAEAQVSPPTSAKPKLRAAARRPRARPAGERPVEPRRQGQRKQGPEGPAAHGRDVAGVHGGQFPPQIGGTGPAAPEVNALGEQVRREQQPGAARGAHHRRIVAGTDDDGGSRPAPVRRGAPPKMRTTASSPICVNGTFLRARMAAL